MEIISKRRGKKAEPIILLPKQVLIEMKRCVSCGEYKELGEYQKEPRAINGLRGSCKSCEALKNKKRRAAIKREKQKV